jgi:hypothetical protein
MRVELGIESQVDDIREHETRRMFAPKDRK